MRRRDTLRELFTYVPPIDRRKSIHKALDATMTNKTVVVTNQFGSFSGPYLSHTHRRKIGDTVLIYLCTECINNLGVTCPNQITVMNCTDCELDRYIKIEQRDGIDQQKQEFFGTTNLNQIRSILRYHGYVV